MRLHPKISNRNGPQLSNRAGLARTAPGLAAVTLILLLSLTGIPPTAGFMGKLYVFGAAIGSRQWAWLAAVGVVNSVISAYYYLRVVAAMAWPAHVPATPAGLAMPRGLQAAVALAAVAVVVLGLWPGPVVDLARLAAAAIWGG